MRSSIDIEEVVTYAACPERERFRKLADSESELEKKYKQCVRTILVRYYGELMDGHAMTYNELRRMWSTYWDIPVNLMNRKVRKDHRSFLNAAMTDEEMMMLKGVKLLEAMSSRRINQEMIPLMVDEPYSLQFDGVSIEGKFDLVFTYPNKNLWISEWSKVPKTDPKYNLKHAVLMEAFKRTTGKTPTGVLVDYIQVSGDLTFPSYRTPEELAVQVREASQIAKSIQFELYYRRIGAHCRTECPYVNECLGESSIESKK